jgi:hypothetical protein
MLPNAAWCERCSECHSETQRSIVCTICRGSRASSPGGTAIMGKDAAGTPYTAAGGKTNILSFSAKPEKDQVEVTPSRCGASLARQSGR